MSKASGKQRREMIENWIDFLENRDQPEALEDDEEFVTKTLNYQFLDFHSRWWRFAADRETSLLLAPRGHGKSTVMTVAYTLRRALDDPDVRVLIASSTQAQASGFLREIKSHLESNPEVVRIAGGLKGTPWTETEICLASRTKTAKEPTVTALGALGPVISKHYDLIILDDVVDEESARSRSGRERLFNWYYKVLLPTLEPGGKLRVIGTRYHYDDLYGRLIKRGVPVYIEKAITGSGESEKALWEEKFPLKALRKKREEAGPAIFNSQYQNDVSLMQGKIFRPEWIRFGPAPPAGRKFQGVDLAIGLADHNDYFAHVTVASSGKSIHLVSIYRSRLTFEEQFETVKTLFAAHDSTDFPVVTVGIESNSYQEALVQRLRGDGRVPVSSVVQTRDKVARAMRLQGLVQTGRITFPETGAGDLIEEMLAFPESGHDDLVDALGIAVRMALESGRYLDLPAADVDFGPDR